MFTVTLTPTDTSEDLVRGMRVSAHVCVYVHVCKIFSQSSIKSSQCERKINYHLVSLINKHSQTRFSVSNMKASEILCEVLETQ